MRKKPLIIGNWKMNLTLKEGVAFAQSLRDSLSGKNEVLCGICPSFVSLRDIGKVLEGSGIYMAAQNVHSSENGAYTGEVSAPMVKETGCTHVLIGHSERRNIFGETDAFINAKIKAALSVGLKPILCIGEKLNEREDGRTEYVIKNQLKDDLQGIRADEMKEFTIAYEPVWAIGTGKTALPEQANEVHSFIRSILAEKYGKYIAGNVYIQYGGSAKPENAYELLAQPEIDGLLVGGASIKLESFLHIIEAASNP
ncbi:MAG: triose-phosphate isomerase [Candidatus Jettenia sp.]|uniref:Triosephosphate isomerase n=1 Tax=Candidatus Jettenia caeni TaxID=247490 RepID=I3IN58_9BACT|nr:triose-phosphate isomerase [Candidatus Jettenia sp. AMX1]MBC6928037.1 triose-phosphate isomerase [Candidatus Jettenia sp.]WKZ14835.1 MAG: triose-phosphate isomerase [Candidatus Jettenia caeni]KAA0251137.1 MAG: triose-phosphate isomerase [Candidatus Jettenia sp. AMX1]MCE7879324.1 triose-phosphate isomerase [Candidatus Jettenia sp. AMX1]MCQ3927452.1 triose-phosphate isomerase [Candidatus Jettenia sp.]